MKETEVTERKVFRHGSTSKPLDLLQYAKDMTHKHPEIEINIGTDSQKKKKSLIYVTVVSFRYARRGVHYIYRKEKKIRKRKGKRSSKDQFQRLYLETVYSMDIADYLSGGGVKINAIEMDYNSDKKFVSNALIAPCYGMCKAKGYDVIVKPGLQIAVKAADNLCK